MHLVNRFINLVLFAAVACFATSSLAAVLSEDYGANYGGGWIDGSNSGTGFGNWAIWADGDAAAAIANPADSGIAGMETNSFRLSGTTGYANAQRAFAAPLQVGDVFSLQLGNNWDADTGNKGLNIYSGGFGDGNQLININMGGSAAININGSPMFTNYGTAATTLYFEYTNVNSLRVYGTGRDGVETYDHTFAVAGAPDGFRLYAGGMSAGVERYLYANNLKIEGNAALTLSGRTGMPAPWTNIWTVTRSGATDSALEVSLNSSQPASASVPASVQIEAGSNSATFEVVGETRGQAEITATAAGVADASLFVDVFDVAYDDSSYYNGSWTNGANEGMGYSAWTFSNNNGPGVGFTNYAGTFLGNSAGAGGGNVNMPPSGDAFGLYANQSGTGGDPLSEAIRPFSAELAAGSTLSVDLGVNFRDSSKGVMIQDGDTWLFEVAAISDQYVYQNHGGGGGQVVLGGSWTNYAANTAIRVELKRQTATLYDVHIIRSGGYSETTTVTGLSLGGAPDTVRFYNFNNPGGGGNNLFFNRLAIWSGDVQGELQVAGQEGLVVGQTNILRVGRTGGTGSQVEFTVTSDNTNVVVVTADAPIESGDEWADAQMVGVGRGQATLTISADGFDDRTVDIEVFDLAYDSSSYYGPGTWTNESNEGRGYGAWMLAHNDGVHDGYTNFAGAFLGDSTASGGGDVNAISNNAFGLYANQVGDDTGTNEPIVEATRSFAALALGQSLTVDLGVNFRNGAKGVMLQNGATWLFEVVVTADQYAWQNHALGGSLQDLGWDYAADSAINVQITRVGQDKYDIALTRTGSAPEYTLLEGISFANQTLDRARFYVWNTEQEGGNNLYVNRMGMNAFDVLEMEGVVNVDFGGTTTIYVRRSDPTGPLTVNLSSAAPAIISVPATVEFADGQAVTSFVATAGATESLTTIHAEADGYVGAPLLVNVFDFPSEFDNAGNYIPGLIVPTTFTNGSNGGLGFGPWQFSALTDGALIELGDSTMSTAWINSFNNRSFGFFGGTASNYASAYRDLDTPLAEGDQFECLLAMKWSGGNRGLDIQDASGNKLFNFDLSFENISAISFGADPGTDLGWGYNPTAVVQVSVKQIAGNQLDVTLTRNDGLTTNVVSSGLTAPMGRVNFYNGGHDAGSLNYALFVNDLLITRAGGETDGIPNSWWDKYGVAVSNRVASLDIDVDGSPNNDEYDGDTDPTDGTRSFANRVLSIRGNSVATLQVGPNTTNSRTYDIWWSAELMGQDWTPMGLNAAAAVDGGKLNMVITNEATRRFFRTSVNIP